MFRLYVIVIGIYGGVQLFLSILMRIPACHLLTNQCDRWPLVRFIKWMRQVRPSCACLILFFSARVFWPCNVSLHVVLLNLCFYFASEICFVRNGTMLDVGCMRGLLILSSKYLKFYDLNPLCFLELFS